MTDAMIQAVMSEGASVTLTMTAEDLRSAFRAIAADAAREVLAAERKAREAAMVPAAEAAKRLGVSHTTLRAWEASGYLLPVRIGVRKMYKESDLADIQSRRSKTI